jgi:uncharacterized NAD(P)/FAD-binding protein YdhS
MPDTSTQPHIAIIGAGFSGLMTAIHLIKNATAPLTIYLINNKATFGRGAAYSTQSYKHLLNVPTAKMSALADDPTHFLDWALKQPAYQGINKDALGKTFLPRRLFGQYIASIWEETLAQKREDIQVNMVYDTATDIEQNNGKYSIKLKAHPAIQADRVVLATGNEAPGNPPIANSKFYESKAYIKNPWLYDVTGQMKPGQDIMIIGNGLTTVDQVISIMESGYKGIVHTISPHGFAILPHRFSHIEYKDFINEVKEPYNFDALFKLGHKHFRRLYRVGISAEPIIDSFRPHTQKIWQSFSQEDKKAFLDKFKSTWNTIRHRLAPHLYDYIQGLRIEGRLVVHTGRLVDIAETEQGALVKIQEQQTGTEKSIQVGLVLNCTGPHMDISRSEDALLRSMAGKGMIRPDSMRIGMDVTAKWTLINKDGKENPTLYTLGGNLRGLLWETTAIPELKVQSALLARQIVADMQANL